MPPISARTIAKQAQALQSFRPALEAIEKRLDHRRNEEQLRHPMLLDRRDQALGIRTSRPRSSRPDDIFAVAAQIGEPCLIADARGDQPIGDSRRGEMELGKARSAPLANEGDGSRPLARMQPHEIGARP
jgi:hypothetical protein